MSLLTPTRAVRVALPSPSSGANADGTCCGPSASATRARASSKSFGMANTSLGCDPRYLSTFCYSACHTTHETSTMTQHIRFCLLSLVLCRSCSHDTVSLLSLSLILSPSHSVTHAHTLSLSLSLAFYLCRWISTNLISFAGEGVDAALQSKLAKLKADSLWQRLGFNFLCFAL